VTSETSSSQSSPHRESCCCFRGQIVCKEIVDCLLLTATSMRSRPTSSMLRMTFFSILTSWDSFFARSGPKAPAVPLRNACPAEARLASRDIVDDHWLTKIAFAEETTALGGRWRWGRVLDLGSGRSARLAHRVCAMHLERMWLWCASESEKVGLAGVEEAAAAVTGMLELFVCVGIYADLS
jgi:hypothetical protein